MYKKTDPVYNPASDLWYITITMYFKKRLNFFAKDLQSIILIPLQSLTTQTAQLHNCTTIFCLIIKYSYS